MSTCLKRNEPILRLLHRLKPRVVRAVMREAPPDLIKTLCECILNTLKGNIKLNSAQRKKLLRYKNILRILGTKKTSLKKRKAYLQKGGLVGALLGPVLGVLGSLLRLG